MKKFEKGQVVCWYSQAGGYEKEKIGTIVRVVERDKMNPPKKIAMKEFPNHMRKFDGNNVPAGFDEAYLVEVFKSAKAKPRLYMPNPKNLMEL